MGERLMKPQTLKVGDIVVTDTYVNATLWKITKILDGDVVEVALVKFEGDEPVDGVYPIHDFFHLNTKQKEEYRERLQEYRSRAG